MSFHFIILLFIILIIIRKKNRKCFCVCIRVWLDSCKPSFIQCIKCIASVLNLFLTMYYYMTFSLVVSTILPLTNWFVAMPRVYCGEFAFFFNNVFNCSFIISRNRNNFGASFMVVSCLLTLPAFAQKISKP